MIAYKSKSLDELSDSEIVEACESNYLNFWKLTCASPNVEFSEKNGITQFITGIPQDIFNVVLKCNLDLETIESRIDDALNYFKSRHIPLLWHTGLLSEPKDVGRYLEDRGFPNDYDLAAMAFDLGKLKNDDHASNDITIKIVTDDPTSRYWKEVLANSWESPRELISWMDQNACFTPSIEKKIGISMPKKMYLAYLDGKPVSTCMLVWSDEIIGLEMVGTITSAQKKGVGSAVINAALSDACKMGFRFIVVLGTVEGVRLYKKCGFKTFGKLPEHSMDFREK
ncbi:MAG: GNAT family N-acetyltransferase [Thermoplasmata archaeon]|nr:GNAT family N-acetyltransferase [Thermoplasmata archaeon]